MGNLILNALVVLFLGFLLVIKMAFILAVLPFIAPFALAIIVIAALVGGVEWVELKRNQKKNKDTLPPTLED